ncbi:hypothetical protein A6R68_19986, partial [Neotoma lepida]
RWTPSRAAPPARTGQRIREILGGEREEAAPLFPPRLRGLGVKPPGRVSGGGERRKRKGPGGVQEALHRAISVTMGSELVGSAVAIELKTMSNPQEIAKILSAKAALPPLW